jgi:hypothetical protein
MKQTVIITKINDSPINAGSALGKVFEVPNNEGVTIKITDILFLYPNANARCTIKLQGSMFKVNPLMNQDGAPFDSVGCKRESDLLTPKIVLHDPVEWYKGTNLEVHIGTDSNAIAAGDLVVRVRGYVEI